ncbi:MAG: hypothetical protein KDA28_15815 [Phycisphaerales bacterium]|nr:hypothetical protein [Phycisphaerales bacterium]
MADDPFATLSDDDRAAHRRLAVDCFNHTWTFLDMERRTVEQDDTMLHMAHASRFHWGLVGDERHRERGEWLCSRVYAALGRAEAALHHARRVLEICEAHGIGDWDLAFAHEALARAHGVGGDREACLHHLNRATELGGAISDPDDAQHLRTQLASIEVPGI